VYNFILFRNEQKNHSDETYCTSLVRACVRVCFFFFFFFLFFGRGVGSTGCIFVTGRI